MVRQEDRIADREMLLKLLLRDLFDQFEGIQSLPNSAYVVLNDTDRLQWMITFLRINEHLCSAVGYVYLSVLQKLSAPLVLYYTQFSVEIEKRVMLEGPHALNWHAIKKVRAFKKEAIRLYVTYLNCKP